MDLFLKVDEYLSKPLEDIKASYFSSGRGNLRTKILVHPPDTRFNKQQIFDQLRAVLTAYCNFYDNWLYVFLDTPEFFVEHRRTYFMEVVTNIGEKNKAIIHSFGRDIEEMLDLKMKRENLAEVERDTLLEWLSDLWRLSFR